MPDGDYTSDGYDFSDNHTFSEIVHYYPSQMAAAILSIPTGGGGQDTVPLFSEADWEAMSTSEKQRYALVAIQTADSGYDRGVLVNGADYKDFDWGDVKIIIIGGRARSVSSSYVQLGDMRFKKISDGTYLPSQYNNVSSSTKYGSFQDNSCRALFDNNASTKCITSGGANFEWTATFTNAIDISQYNILELWTANDSSERDPFYNVTIAFTDSKGLTVILSIPETNLPTTRASLGYSNNNYKNEVVKK